MWLSTTCTTRSNKIAILQVLCTWYTGARSINDYVTSGSVKTSEKNLNKLFPRSRQACLDVLNAKNQSGWFCDWRLFQISECCSGNVPLCMLCTLCVIKISKPEQRFTKGLTSGWELPSEFVFAPKNSAMKVLNVAEKNDAAKALANVMGAGRARRVRRGLFWLFLTSLWSFSLKKWINKDLSWPLQKIVYYNKQYFLTELQQKRFFTLLCHLVVNEGSSGVFIIVENSNYWS